MFIYLHKVHNMFMLMLCAPYDNADVCDVMFHMSPLYLLLQQPLKPFIIEAYLGK